MYLKKYNSNQTSPSIFHRRSFIFHLLDIKKNKSKTNDAQ